LGTISNSEPREPNDKEVTETRYFLDRTNRMLGNFTFMALGIDCHFTHAYLVFSFAGLKDSEGRKTPGKIYMLEFAQGSALFTSFKGGYSELLEDYFFIFLSPLSNTKGFIIDFIYKVLTKMAIEPENAISLIKEGKPVAIKMKQKHFFPLASLDSGSGLWIPGIANTPMMTTCVGFCMLFIDAFSLPGKPFLDIEEWKQHNYLESWKREAVEEYLHDHLFNNLPITPEEAAKTLEDLKEFILRILPIHYFSAGFVEGNPKARALVTQQAYAVIKVAEKN
jgi:hypothetical protein